MPSRVLLRGKELSNYLETMAREYFRIVERVTMSFVLRRFLFRMAFLTIVDLMTMAMQMAHLQFLLTKSPILTQFEFV